MPPTPGRLVSSPYHSAGELREVLEKLFTAVCQDPAAGPKLRDAGVSLRYELGDVGLTFDLRPGDDGERCLVWSWDGSDEPEPNVRLAMSAETANRYFQGKENMAIAIARRRIRAGGDARAALVIIPLLKPVFERYRQLVADDYPHLEV